MKDKKSLIIPIFLLLISCAANKTRLIPFKEISKIEAEKRYENYSIEIPKHWFPYLWYHGEVHYSPRGLEKKDIKHFRNFIKIYSYTSQDFEGNTLSDFFNFFIEKKKKSSLGFVHNSEKLENANFGEFYLTTYEYKHDGEIHISLNILVSKGINFYVLNYSSLEKYYDVFFPDALKIMDSFEMK